MWEYYFVGMLLCLPLFYKVFTSKEIGDLLEKESGQPTELYYRVNYLVMIIFLGIYPICVFYMLKGIMLWVLDRKKLEKMTFVSVLFYRRKKEEK